MVLTGKNPPKIADNKRKNLSSLITKKYGAKCVEHPRMENLMHLNGGTPRDFLGGQSEADAFKNGEYIKLHKSTMSKVYWFTETLNNFLFFKIYTQNSNIKEKINSIIESTPAKVVGLISSLLALSVLYEWGRDLSTAITNFFNSIGG